MSSFIYYLHYAMVALVNVPVVIIAFGMVFGWLKKKKQKTNVEFSKKYYEDYQYALALRRKKLVKEIDDRLADNGVKLDERVLTALRNLEAEEAFVWLEGILIEIEHKECNKEKFIEDGSNFFRADFPYPRADGSYDVCEFKQPARLMTEEEKMERKMLKDLHLLP